MARAQHSKAGNAGGSDPQRPRAMPVAGQAAGAAPIHQHQQSIDKGDPIAEATQNGAMSWRFLSVVEITNFAALRRLLGAERADGLVFDIADRVLLNIPDVRVAVTGRRTVEFTGDAASFAEIEQQLEALRLTFEIPFDLDGESHRIELCLGAAALPTSQADDLRLIEEAEQAIRLARTEKRVVMRDLAGETPAFDRQSLIRDLHGAVGRGEMFLQYQPKVHLRRQEITGVEALVRWQHPTRGLIFPGDFIPIAEQAQVIAEMTMWSLGQVIADQRTLAARGHDLTIFVNISGQLLSDPVFVAHACQVVRNGGAKIGFEITETSVIRDPGTAINHLQVFAEMGIPIAIDDYGAGLSSLAYLKQLPANELKIDKMFVIQLTSSNRDPLIVRSTIDLAHALDMEVTAEGVETQAALALLTVMGCDMVQGFLISRPISFDALVPFLDEQRHLSATAHPRASFSRSDSFWKRA